MLHRLRLSQGTLHGYFSRDLEPALTIGPGDSVRFAVPNSSWYIEPERKFAPRDPTLDVGHALVGPIAVRGARVGQTLVVRIDEVNPASWGVTYTKPPHLIRWQLSDGVGRGSGQTVRLAPFLGGPWYAAGRTRRAFDDSAAPFRWQNRLQRARRRISFVPTNCSRGGALLGR